MGLRSMDKSWDGPMRVALALVIDAVIWGAKQARPREIMGTSVERICWGHTNVLYSSTTEANMLLLVYCTACSQLTR